GRQGDGLASGEKPRLVHAVPVLCHRDAGHVDSLWSAPDRVPSPEVCLMNWSRIIPGSAVGTAVMFLLLQMPSPKPSADGMALDEFATLPVVADGRIKPVDSVARTSLMIISKRQTFTDEK